MNDEYIRENFPLYIAHLEKYNYITLDHENTHNWGALDPISFLPPMKAKELVQVIFEQVYDFKGKDDINTAFLRATSEVIDAKQKGEQVGSLDIIRKMQSHPEEAVQKAGDYLNEVVSDSILKLCIHDGSNPALSLEKRITILEVENMDLPDHAERLENYTISQLKSSAVMFALGKFCELFGMNQDEQTVEFIDEAWIFTTSQQGKKVERQMRRIGRSYNNAEYFISQSTKDALKEEDSGNFEMEGTVAVMRNLYFDIALMKPFLIVNFDETSEKKINEKDTDKGGLNRIDKLLSYKLSEDGEKDKKDYIKETEIDEYKNESMTSGNVFNQLGESFIAVVASIVIGIPFLALAFFNFLLQVVALVIVFFVPFAFILAYVPQLAYSGFVTLGRLGSVYLLKAMLGIIVLFVYVTCFIVDKLIPPNGFGMYLLNVAVLASILWIGFHKRDAIIKFVTAGKVVSVDNNMMENMRQNIVQPAWEQAKKIGGVWGPGVDGIVGAEDGIRTRDPHLGKVVFYH
ncbi:hypothetical protein BSG8_42570 [Bacillus subtilis subsp. natto]|nr:hypothetical protein BSG8_42570 [Bacillus subtilis subsp. natto]